MSMNMNQPAVYWRKNQIAVTFHSDLPINASINDVLPKLPSHQDELNKLLSKNTKFTLKSPNGNPAPQQQMSTNAMSPQDNSGSIGGVYWFPSPRQPQTGIGVQEPMDDLIVFYTIEGPAPAASPTPSMPVQSTTNSMGGMSGAGGTGGMGSMGGAGSMSGGDPGDYTIAVVKELYAQKGANDAFDVMPHWFFAGTGDVTHGCPITPPIPAPGFDPSGQWTFTLPQLAGTPLQDKTGAGVTVFILDAFPTADQITTAANNAACNNLLVQMATGMVTADPFNAVPPAININYFEGAAFPQDIVTGKDLYGNLAGFPMLDHGLAIAGIVRDLAPNAKIECIQVLNDHGVGYLDTLTRALTTIRSRMEPEGDLFGMPVVINLSLVIGPPEGDLSRLTLDKDMVKLYLTGIHSLVQNLTSLGAIFVASAGNDSDPRDKMHAAGERLGPRYPANFAYDLDAITAASIIPVGAVNGQGEAASYSNFPGPNGVATYGGELPVPYPSPADPSVITQVDPTVPLDAPCSVYSGSLYPALSMNDKYPPPSPPPPAYPEYPAPDGSAWAYWAGTSFATPIISALAALLLEGQAPKTVAVRNMLATSLATQQTAWAGLAPDTAPVNGPTIMATQEFSWS